MKNKEKIDDFLKNRMGNQEHSIFEREIESNKILAEEVRQAKIKQQAAECVKRKGQSHPSQPPHIGGQLKTNTQTGGRRSARLFARKADVNHKYLLGIGLAVSIFFIILLFDVFTSYPSAYEDIETAEIVQDLKRPHNLEYYMQTEQYQKALLVIDSIEKDLLLTYSKSTIGEDNDSVKNNKSKRKKRTSLALYELAWDKINVYIGLQEYDKAFFLLTHFKEKDGIHKKDARSYWNKLEKEKMPH